MNWKPWKKKPLAEDKPVGIYDEQDEKYLLKRKAALQEVLDKFEDRARNRKATTGVASVVAATGMVIDIGLLGGAGMIFMTGYGLLWARNQLGVEQVRDQLEDVQQKLMECQRAKEAHFAALGQSLYPASRIDRFNGPAAPASESEKRANKPVPKSPFDPE